MCAPFAGAHSRAHDPETSRAPDNYNNYKEFFAVNDKTLVKHKVREILPSSSNNPAVYQDGTYEALTRAELNQGMREKRIGVGYAGTGWTNYADRNPYFFIE